MYYFAGYGSILSVLAGSADLANTNISTTHKIYNGADYSCAKNAKEQVDPIEYAADVLMYFIIH